MTLRKCLFWCHLTGGVLAGVVILIMSVSGVLLTYEKQIMLWADTRHYTVAPPSATASRLSMEALIAKAAEAEPHTTFTTVTVRASAGAPVAFAAASRMLYLDPYTGSLLGEGSPGVRRFFRIVTDWHRTLAFSGERRGIGRAITGACNLVFLFIVSSGIYLWWPRTWTRRQLRTVTIFKGGLRGKARDFNWHNVIGFWSAIPLFIIVLGSVVISYPWASDMVYRIVGESPPPRPGVSGGTGVSAQTQSARAARGQDAGTGNGDGNAAKPPAAGIDAAWARAEQQVPGWRTISFRLPATAESPVVFTIDKGTGGQPQKRGTLTLMRPGADILKWEPFASLSEGRQIRSWLRFAHTGEVYGLVGQTIAGLVSAGAAVLMYTGLALAFRRLVAWRVRLRNVRFTPDAARSTELVSAWRNEATEKLP
jgi:uncharacterized iron-regulated membrane protein